MPAQRAHIPVKVERTHEENQERAYIAASRRSDRSLEARVESARRASEIHKRRTGRALKVTEQDVINEEMYEEEDDSHLSRFSCLARSISTNSSNMNKSVQALLATHIGMREHLFAKKVHADYEQHFPGHSQSFNNNQFPTQPFLDPNVSMQMNPQSIQSMNMMHMNMDPNNMHNYTSRPAPYPANRMAHSRSASIAFPTHQTQLEQTFTPQMQPDLARRHSMATFQQYQSRPVSPTAMRTSQTMYNTPIGPSYTASNQYNSNNNHSAFTDPFPTTSDIMFSPILPNESQLLIENLNSVPFEPPLMDSYGHLNQPWDSAIHPPRRMSNRRKTNYRGLDATLAPSAMTRSSSQGDFNAIGGPNSGMGFFDAGYMPSSQAGSAASTPGVNGESWNNFINEGCWDSVTGQ